MGHYKNQSINVGQDGGLVNEPIKNYFRLKPGIDTRYKQKREDLEIYDFVGLINTKEKSLAVFPKHYFSTDKINDVNDGQELFEDDLRLLFDTIYKYIATQKAKAISYAGENLEFDSDYPFSHFFSIYKHFQQFGIYQERYTRTKIGSNGKISWKDTIKKSSKIFSNENVIHLPFYIKQKRARQVFISDCMAFVIDNTLDRFPFLFSMQKTNHKKTTFDFLQNIDFVVNCLQSTKAEVFKDVHKKLVQDLIDFFSELNDKSKGGEVHIKIRYFNLVWESMIEHYLNAHFVGVSEGSLIFNEIKGISQYQFEKKTFKIDKSDNSFTIEPDHYFIDSELQFIFDAKYYDSLNTLNYKQFSYHEMLKYKLESKKTISALIVPSESGSSSEIHFSLADEFVRDGDGNTTIILQKVKMKDVMLSYCSSM